MHAFPLFSLGCGRFSLSWISKSESESGERLYAGVAQLVEQLTCNQQVDGPNPPASSAKRRHSLQLFLCSLSASAGKRAGSEVVKRIRL